MCSMANRTPFGKETLIQYPIATIVVRTVARRLGYAIGVHGSETYDLDLIAAPWVDDCSTPEELAYEISQALQWYLSPKVGEKPHGRKSFLIYGPEHAHIDLAVLPKENK